MLIFSSLLAISSSSWFMVWIFMEVNSLSMCSLISKEMKKENESNKQALIYLIIQLTASIIFLLSVNSANSNILLMLICLSCLMLKSGVWPFHLWYMKTLSLMKIKQKTMAIIMTWQKIIPMLLMPHLTIKKVLMFMALGSMITPMVKLKKVSSFKTIMISSSLNNNAWLILSSMASSLFFNLYLLVYSISLFVTFNMFKSLKTKSSMKSKIFWESMATLGNMGGVPPMIMFTAKLMMFTILIQTKYPKEIMLLMMLMACLFMYHYMWATSNHLTKMPTKSQMWKKESSILSQSMLLMSPILVWLLLFLGLSS